MGYSLGAIGAKAEIAGTLADTTLPASFPRRRESSNPLSGTLPTKLLFGHRPFCVIPASLCEAKAKAGIQSGKR